MRVTQSEIYRNFVADLEKLNSNLGSISRQFSSGKKVTRLSDSPSASAVLVSLSKQQSDLEYHRLNVDAASLFLTVADSALNEVNNLLTSVHTKGSQAASEILTAEGRAAVGSEIRAMRDQIVSLANSQARGHYIFAGSAVTSAPFVRSGDAVTYHGNEEVSSVVIGDGLEVRQGVPGSNAFDSVFRAIEGLLDGIDSDDLSAIKASLDQFSSAFSDLGQVRGQVGANLGLLRNVTVELESQKVGLKEQRGLVEDANMAEVVVRLKEIETALQTTVAAGGSILQQSNLFDILG